MSPVNTSYLNHAKPIAFPSLFTVALTAQTVTNATTVESSFSIPPRLLPQGTGNLALRAGDVIFVGPDSALSAGLVFSAYPVPTTNTVTLRFGNVANSGGTLFSINTVVQRAGTWTIGYFGIMP